MQRSSKLRISLVFSAFIVLYLIVIGNLYLIQIHQSDFFHTLANRQYHIELTHYPLRGRILDRYGRPLAINKESLSAFILPKQIQNLDQLQLFLQEYFPLAQQRLLTNQDKHFLYVARRFPSDLCDQVECDAIVDLKFMKEPSRFYPQPAVGQVVGVTNIDNQGIFGLEFACNQSLAGQPSRVILEKDARSSHFYFKHVLQNSGCPGEDLVLTIDADLQYLVRETLADTVDNLQAEFAMAIVLDPQNGEILSMLSYPDFDPNDMQVLDLNNTKLRPVTDCYEFGSIMKVFVALAALAEGVVQPDELIDCENLEEAVIDGMRFTTVKSSVRGEVPFKEVISCSNNIGIVKVAKRLGPKLYQHYLNFGFGQPTGIDFSGEQVGTVSHPSKWSKRSIISLAFGYEVSANLLQVARAFAVIANGGYLITPHLDLMGSSAKIPTIYDSQVLASMRDILRQSVQRGTGVRAQITGYDICGKTGTANLAVNGAYAQDQLILTFGCIVQKDDYQRVIVTCIKGTKKGPRLYGSNTAAPLSEKIATQMLVHDRVV